MPPTKSKSAYYFPASKFWRVWFWLNLIFETVTFRRLSRLVKLWLEGYVSFDVKGLENIPQTGNFVLALNHYQARATLDLIVVTVAAISQVRPDLYQNLLLITGRRVRHSTKPMAVPARVVSWVVGLVFGRWQNHLLRIPWSNQRASVRALREWRERSQYQTSVVFPEGKANLEFMPVRKGAGRWLAGMPEPIVPVAVWRETGRWQVRFGPPIVWSHRPELHDLQLGLNIANLLPADLAPDWQENLALWHSAHLQRVD